MANEQEVRSGEKRATCSVTGNCCRCGDSGRCESRLGDGKLDTPSDETLRWTKSALCRTDIVEGDIERAIEGCLTARAYPGPELREARRLASALRTALAACVG